MSNQARANLKVVYLPISELKKYPNNPRVHSPRQIRQIARSFKKFGLINPILIDRSKTVIAGHGRVAAAELLGIDTVPTICLEDLTDEEIRLYRIADNELALKGGWDYDMLRIEMQNLDKIEGLDLTLTGFVIAEIDDFLQEPNKRPDPDDAIPSDDNQIAVTCHGDLWLLKKHRVYCGDSATDDPYSTLMKNRLAGIAVLDPPYNVRIHGHVSGNGSIRHREFIAGSGEMTDREFEEFLSKTLNRVAKHSTSGSIHYVFMDWRGLGQLLLVGKQVYDSLLNICCWKKDVGGMGSFYRSQHEMIAVFKHGKKTHLNNIELGRHGRNRTNVWEYPGLNTLSRQSEEGNLLKLHPTVKPVALVADALLDCSSRGTIVLDAFLGSGSTLIAADRTGRICHGIELDPLYVDVAIRRWQRYTGETAIHADSGKTFDALAAERGV